MKKVAVFAVIAFMVFATAAFAGGAGCGGTEKKSCCSNPIGDTIDQTPSIKAMQSKPACGRSWKTDVLGNKVADQTDNSGQNCLGR
jgi:hypothetical protein